MRQINDASNALRPRHWRSYTLRMLLGDYYFSLEIDGQESLLEDQDPSFYAYSTRGSVIGTDEAENKVVAGKFHLYYLDVCAAVNAKSSVFDIFDCRAATLDFYEAIFEPGSLDISGKLDKLFKDAGVWGNILILNRLEILPTFRGHNLSLVVMRRLIERFGGGAAYVAIKPFPLQHEYSHRGEEDDWRKALELPALDRNSKRATSKLRQHYAKLGFKLLKGTPFMFRLGDCALPSPEHLIK